MKYAKELKDKDGRRWNVRKSKGSVDNLNLLLEEGSDVSVAIIQSGVIKPEDSDKLIALGSLYVANLSGSSIAATKPLFIESLPPKKAVIATGGKAGACTTTSPRNMLTTSRRKVSRWRFRRRRAQSRTCNC